MRSKLGREFGGFSPLAVFGVLVIVVAALGAAVVLLQPDADPADPARTAEGSQPGEASEQEDDLRLTNAEAIARFKELDAGRIEALERRQPSLARAMAGHDTPLLRRVLRTIRGLKRNSIVVDELWDLQGVRVVHSSNARIQLRAEAISDTRFFGEEGVDVTRTSRKELRTLDCEMRRFGRRWLLHECEVTSAKAVK